MFCPECGLVFHEGVTRCLDCDLTLITLPEEGEEAGEQAEFLPLVEVTDVAAFALVTSCLEQAGVAWFVQSEPPLGVAADPGGSMAVIYVAENHLDPARRALESANLAVVG